MRILALAVLIVLISAADIAQPVGSLPKFLGADIHASRHLLVPQVEGPFTGGGIYKLRYATLVDLIGLAYNVETNRVVGGPSWLELDRFDIIAKPPSGSTAEARKLMLGALLADRFHLVARAETRPMRASALKAGQHLQMKRSDGSAGAGCGYFRRTSLPLSPPPA